jgi:hypothetical protein
MRIRIRIRIKSMRIRNPDFRILQLSFLQMIFLREILYLKVIEILEEAVQIARLLQLLIPLLEHGCEQLPDLAQLVGALPDHYRLLGMRDRDLLRLLVQCLKLSLKIRGWSSLQ